MNLDALNSVSPQLMQQLGPMPQSLQGLTAQLPGASMGQGGAQATGNTANANAPWNSFLESAQSIEGLRDSVRQLQAQMPTPTHLETAGAPQSAMPTVTGLAGSSAPSFSETIGQLLDGLDAKRDASQVEVNRLLRGESDNLHQAMIAREESSLAFTMMVEVRNKLTEGFQELMRMTI